MALTNKITAIADAIREKRGNENDLTLDTMPTEIKKIPSSAYLGSTIAPAASNYPITNQFSAIGNAIRYKTGGAATLTLDEMPDAIRSIGYKVSGELDMGWTDGSASQLITVQGIGTCTDTDIVIPREYKFAGAGTSYRPVDMIGHNAFENNTTITSLTIPYGDIRYGMTVGAYSFRNCSNLATVALSNDMELICSYAFAGCTSLRNVDLGVGLLTIQNNVFDGCTSLTSLVIPETVTSIASGAFLNCRNLILEVDSGNTTYQAKNNCLINGTTVEWVGYKNASLPTDGSVTRISAAYLDRTDLTSVVIPEGILELQSTFYGCSNLRNVTLPNSLVTIDYKVFEDCESLTSITIPAAVETVGNNAFKGCTNLESLIFKGTPTTLADNAFSGMSASTNIYVPWGSDEGPSGYWWRNTDATIHYNHTA